MTPFLSLLGAAAVVAAPLAPGSAARTAHYQKVADGLMWADAADRSTRSLEEQLPGYVINYREVRGVNVNSKSIRVIDAGKELCAWEDRGAGAYLALGDVLYRADYHPNSSGCAVVAFDLKARKELWKTTPKGLGPIGHSKYRNQVWLERLDDVVFAVYGKESAGRYVELVDFKTGQTVGHKVFPRD